MVIVRGWGGVGAVCIMCAQHMWCAHVVRCMLIIHAHHTGYEGIVAKLKWNVSIRESPPWKRVVQDTALGTDEQL